MTPVPPERPSGLAAVPIWAALAATALAIFVIPSLVLLPVIVLELLGVSIDLDSPPPAFVVSGTLLLDAGLVATAYVAARASGLRIRPSTLGIRSTAAGRALLWTGAVYATFWAATIAYTLVVGQPGQQAIVEDLKAERSVLVLGAFALMVGLAAPLAEEIFFRGFLFGVLREKIGVVAAALVAGAIFGVIHAAGSPLRTLGILVLLGIGLCFLYFKTGSLLPGMGLHSFHNSISFALTKEVDPVVGVLLVVGCVGLTLGIGSLFVRSEASASP